MTRKWPWLANLQEIRTLTRGERHNDVHTHELICKIITKQNMIIKKNTIQSKKKEGTGVLKSLNYMGTIYLVVRIPHRIAVLASYFLVWEEVAYHLNTYYLN